ncbi:MAG TPA: hypothetical protein VFW15_03410, partial [Thermoanaerobaculia bacterium]|nr:hypothetical protein [Thermoanaerobaculia bacterium]
IERTSKDGSRLAPVLAREKTLPPATLEALKDRAVVAGRGKLAGPAAEELASRGMVVERGRSVQEVLSRTQKPSDDRGPALSRGTKGSEKVIGGGVRREAPVVAPRPESGDVWRGRAPEKGGKAAPESSPAPAAGEWRGRSPGLEKGEKPAPGVAPAPSTSDWRGRGGQKVDRPAPEVAPRQKAPDRAAPAPRPAEDWRGRGESNAPPRSDAPPSPQIERQKPAKQFASEDGWRGQPESRSPGRAAPQPQSQDWRRGEPPAKRVIEGAVPGRRGKTEAAAPRESAPPVEWRQRGPERSAPAPSYQPRENRPAPAPREYRPAPGQIEPREYKAPREYRPESRPQPAPRAPQYSAPPEPRAPQYSAPPAPRNNPHSAPAPNVNSGSKSHGKGRKG